MASCPVCGDQIINGRCRFCGMPYRNDEAMYHLNESSHDHYRHSSSDVRKKMREAAVPLGDKPQEAKRPATRAEMQAKQQQIRQEAMKKMTQTSSTVTTARSAKTVANVNGKKQKIRTNQTTYSSKSGRQLSGKKKKGSGLLWLILVIIFAVARSETLRWEIQKLIWRLGGSF